MMLDTTERVIAWIDNLTGDDVAVYPANQTAPKPPKPFVTVLISGSSHAANEMRANVDEFDALKGVRWGLMTVSLSVFGRGFPPLSSGMIAQLIMDGLFNDIIRIDNLGRGVTLGRIVNGPQSIDEVVGIEWESRAILEFTLNFSQALEYQVGGIERVEIDGTTGGTEFTTVSDASGLIE
ncbi:MAG: hypothetical protein IBX56_02310 [Methylomicrobium sp.]|nr:hypothetical protein [Methylomicrobium sp.]